MTPTQVSRRVGAIFGTYLANLQTGVWTLDYAHEQIRCGSLDIIQIAALAKAIACVQCVEEESDQEPIINKVFVPPHMLKPEPVAHLIYAGEVFEIGYTMMGWLSGWIAIGAHGSSLDHRIAANIKAAFTHIVECMCWDNSPPPEDEHTAVLRRLGYKVKRHEYVCPHPEITKLDPDIVLNFK